MIKFHCFRCKQRIGVPEAHAGKSVSCPRCQTVVDVPAPKPELPSRETPLDLEVALPQRNWAHLANLIGELDREADPARSKG